MSCCSVGSAKIQSLSILTGQGLCEVYRRPRMCFQDPCRAIEDRRLHFSFAVSGSVLHEACSPHTRFSPLARRVGN